MSFLQKGVESSKVQTPKNVAQVVELTLIPESLALAHVLIAHKFELDQ